MNVLAFQRYFVSTIRTVYYSFVTNPFYTDIHGARKYLNFTITSGVMFINEKPKIDASPLQNSIWNITSNDTSISNFLDTLTNNSSYINLDSLTLDILFNGSYFQATSGQIYLIDNEKISQISTDSLSITNVEQFIKQGQEEVNNGRTYINDFSYVIN